MSRSRVFGSVALALALVVGLASCDPNTPPTGDGLSAENAGASCWGIKQAFPASADGVYWVYTPALDRPTQFYCDMTTDGGGWVLVGRGRDGWTFDPNGQGTAATVRTVPDGVAAFAPAALPPTTIEGLLNGTDLTDLDDGIRVERATNVDGSVRQDLRLFPAYDRWTWSLPVGQRLSSVRIDGTSYANGNTRDTGATYFDYPPSPLYQQGGTNRMITVAIRENNWRSGFGHGFGVAGCGTGGTNFLYCGASGFSLPFSRVWLRPTIANSALTWSPLPDAGLPAEVNAIDTLKSRPEVAAWGVVGLDHTDETSITPWYTQVNVLKAYSDRVFVGGRFTGVQQGPNGAVTAQASLAAFDLDGNWISTFRPVVAGRVWDMTMTTDGKLIIAGDFTSVNGEPDTAGVAALDPHTGQVVASWKANISRTSGSMVVRALDSRGPWIYAAGRFNQVYGGGSNPQTVSNAVSLSTSTGAPGNWKPVLSGSAVRVRAAAAGDRVYVVGYFDTVNLDPNHHNFAVTDTVTGAPVPVGPWQPSEGSVQSTRYQQAVAENGDEVLVGGSQHDFQSWDRDRNTLLDANIMLSVGGDGQAIEVFDDAIYLGCHCEDRILQGTNSWTHPAGFRAVYPIRSVVRLDPVTRDVDPAWYPGDLRSGEGEGVWSITRDQRGCVWVGGDLVRGASTGNPVNDWLGGFGRFCPTDTTPPSAPSGLQATAGSNSVALTWSPGADETSTVTYDVFRNNRVIATVSGTSYTDTTVTGAARYAVRAVDASGNDSATTPVLAVNGPAVVVDQPVAFGSTWSYLADDTDQGTAWSEPGFDDSTWGTGPGTFGWGTGTEATVLPAQPLTSYYRRSFAIDDLDAVRLLDLDLKVNAGAVVHVNGVEVGRINMPAGSITAATPAASYICCAEEARIKQILVPRQLLRAGTNTVAVELHAWHPDAGRAFFDLQATTLGNNNDTTAPTAPVLDADPGIPSGIALTWSGASDTFGVAGYLLTRDGEPVVAVGPETGSWLDLEVAPGSTHTYLVTVFDTNGNTRASAPVTASAAGGPVPEDEPVLEGPMAVRPDRTTTAPG